MNACDAIRPRLEELRVDLLSPPEREAAEKHIQACPDCEARLRRIQEIERALLEAPAPDIDIQPLIQESRARVARERRRKEAIPMAAAALLLLSILAWLVAPGGSGTGPSTSQDPLEEKRLGELPPDSQAENLLWSPDGRHWAYPESLKREEVKETAPGKVVKVFHALQRMVVNGQAGREFNAVSDGVFSPNGRKLAYLARTREGYVVVVEEIGKGTTVLEGVYSSISKWDEESGKPPVLRWSPTSASLAYMADKGEEAFVVIDGKRHGPHPQVTQFVWSPDGKSFAYVARHGNEWYVVRDGKKGEIFDQVLHLSFAPDGTPAFVAQEDKSFLVWGERRHPEFLRVGPPVFSPDGKNVAYSVGRLMILNGEASRPYESTSDPVFSPDGRRLAYRCKTNAGEMVVIRQGGAETPEDSFSRVDVPRFSPSGDVVAYRAWRGIKQVMVVGQRVGEKFSQIGDPVFSPDGRVVAYSASRYGKEVVVVGDRVSEEVDRVLWGPVFSPDGKKVSYRAQIGRELWSKVLDVP